MLQKELEDVRALFEEKEGVIKKHCATIEDARKVVDELRARMDQQAVHIKLAVTVIDSDDCTFQKVDTAKGRAAAKRRAETAMRNDRKGRKVASEPVKATHARTAAVRGVCTTAREAARAREAGVMMAAARATKQSKAATTPWRLTPRNMALRNAAVKPAVRRWVL
jgi:creatinine amidohydrolase/Fe(II)-dependent formamide hydrolase-like protein